MAKKRKKRYRKPKKKKQVAHVSPFGTKDLPKDIGMRTKNPKQKANQIAEQYKKKGYKVNVVKHDLKDDKHYDVYVRKD